jgi:nitrogen regulatory protein PII
VEIYRLLENSSFGRAEIKQMIDAYEMALRVLEVERSDPMMETIAWKIIRVARTGERGPSKICVRAMKELGMVPLK